VGRNIKKLSVKRQCELLGVSRSSLYYQPAVLPPADLELMRMLDEQYLKTPFFGSRRMTEEFRSRGVIVTRKRVRRLMKVMGLEAIYQKPRTSIASDSHKKY